MYIKVLVWRHLFSFNQYTERTDETQMLQLYSEGQVQLHINHDILIMLESQKYLLKWLLHPSTKRYVNWWSMKLSIIIIILASEPVFGGLTCYGEACAIESGPATFEASLLVATEGSCYIRI